MSDMEPMVPPPKGKAGGRLAGRSGMAAFAFVARSLQQVSTFVVTLLAASFLLPAEYGIYALAIVFVTFIQTMTYTGFYHFIVTSKHDDAAVLSTSFWLIVGLATAATVIFCALAYPISWLFAAPELAPILILLTIIQPLAGAGAWSSAALLRRQAVNLHFVIMFVQNALALVGGVLLIWYWQSLYALVAVRYVRVLSGTLLYATLGRDRPSFRFDRALVPEAAVFSGNLYGSRLLNFLSRYAADLLLGLMFTPAAAGLYRFGNRVATGATDIVTQPMQSFALTQMGAAGRKGKDLTPVLGRFIGTTTILTGGVAATVIVMAPSVVQQFFKPDYMAALVVTYALAIRSVLGLGALLLEPVMAATGQTGLILRYNFAWTVVFVAVAFAASPFGLEALAWSQAAATGLSTLTAGILVQRHARVPAREQLRSFAVASALVVAYGAALHFGWTYIGEAVADRFLALGLGLSAALLLGLMTIAAGWRVKVWSLSVFSG